MYPVPAAAFGVAQRSRGVSGFPWRTASVRLTPGCACEPSRFLFPEAAASPLVGVGQVFSAAPASLPCVVVRSSALTPPFQSFAPAVGHAFAHVSSDGRCAAAVPSRAA